MSTPAKLLRYLVDGQFHSGEELARSLGVTRAAIWKYVQKLSNDFMLDIHAVSGRGYRLSQAVELLEPEHIRRALLTSHASLEIETHLSLDSTSEFLMCRELLDENKTTVVFAEQQNAGRGRRGRKWVSPFGGSLYFSILHRFDAAMHALSGLSLAVGVAIAGYLHSLGLNARLKWPNDILVNGRKLCGILLEMRGESHGPGDVVIGVGLNIMMPASASSDIEQPWTTLAQELGSLKTTMASRNQLAGEVLKHILQALDEFSSEGLLPFKDRWQAWDAYANHPVILQLGEKSIQGIARGIDSQGAILIEHDHRLQHYYSGEVSLRPGKI